MITSSAPIKDNDGEIIGITVRATVKKNKVGPPMRKVEFDIIFGEGIDESESLYALLKKASSKNPIIVGDKGVTLSDAGSWKKLIITDPDTGEVLIEKSFVKSKLHKELLNDETFGPLLLDAIDKVMTIKYDASETKLVEGEDSYDVVESTNEDAVGIEEIEE